MRQNACVCRLEEVAHRQDRMNVGPPFLTLSGPRRRAEGKDFKIVISVLCIQSQTSISYATSISLPIFWNSKTA